MRPIQIAQILILLKKSAEKSTGAAEEVFEGQTPQFFESVAEIVFRKGRFFLERGQYFRDMSKRNGDRETIAQPFSWSPGRMQQVSCASPVEV